MVLAAGSSAESAVGSVVGKVESAAHLERKVRREEGRLQDWVLQHLDRRPAGHVVQLGGGGGGGDQGGLLGGGGGGAGLGGGGGGVGLGGAGGGDCLGGVSGRFASAVQAVGSAWASARVGWSSAVALAEASASAESAEESALAESAVASAAGSFLGAMPAANGHRFSSQLRNHQWKFSHTTQRTAYRMFAK